MNDLSRSAVALRSQSDCSSQRQSQLEAQYCLSIPHAYMPTSAIFMTVSKFRRLGQTPSPSMVSRVPQLGPEHGLGGSASASQTTSLQCGFLCSKLDSPHRINAFQSIQAHIPISCTHCFIGVPKSFVQERRRAAHPQ